MPFSRRDQTILADLEKAKATFRDLEEVLAFYEKIFQVQFGFKDRLERQEKAGFCRREIRLQDLANGFPQIRFEELGLQPVPLFTLYQDLVKLLIPYTCSAYDLKRSRLRTDLGTCLGRFGKGPLIVSGGFGRHRQDGQRIGLGSLFAAGMRRDPSPGFPCIHGISGILPRSAW